MARKVEVDSVEIVEQPIGTEPLVLTEGFAQRYGRIVEDYADEAVIDKHFIAAAVLADEFTRRNDLDVHRNAKNLADADANIKIRHGQPVVWVSRTGIKAGSIAGSAANGLAFTNNRWSYTEPYAEIATSSDFSAYFMVTGESGFLNVVEEKGSIETNQGLIKFPAPDNILLPGASKIKIEDAVDELPSQELLVIGEEPVSQVFTALAKQEFAKGAESARQYHSSVALLGISALKAQGVELGVGKSGDLVHRIGVDIVARMIAKGVGNEYDQSELSEIGGIARRLTAVDFVEEDILHITSRALYAMRETDKEDYEASAHEALTTLTAQTGGNLEGFIRVQAANILRNLLGVKSVSPAAS